MQPHHAPFTRCREHAHVVRPPSARKIVVIIEPSQDSLPYLHDSRRLILEDTLEFFN
jgi:hypothetical protein